MPGRISIKVCLSPYPTQRLSVYRFKSMQFRFFLFVVFAFVYSGFDKVLLCVVIIDEVLFRSQRMLLLKDGICFHVDGEGLSFSHE